jgi:hypothetical protein
MIARYLIRRAYGWLRSRLGRTGRGQGGPNTPRQHTDMTDTIPGRPRPIQEVSR